MIYSGMARIVMVRMRYPQWSFSKSDIYLNLSVLIPTKPESTDVELIENLKMKVDDDVPAVGSLYWVLINNDKIKIVE